MQVRTLQEKRARARARVECSAEMQPSRMEGMLLRTPKRAGGTHGCGERERERETGGGRKQDGNKQQNEEPWGSYG